MLTYDPCRNVGDVQLPFSVPVKKEEDDLKMFSIISSIKSSWRWQKKEQYKEVFHLAFSISWVCGSSGMQQAHVLFSEKRSVRKVKRFPFPCKISPH